MASSSIIYVGKSLATLLEDVPATIEYDEEGLSSAELNYTVMWASAPALVSQLLYHPDFPWLKRESATITRIEACMALVKVRFKGIDPNADNDPVYSVSGSTSTEPIETHPKFKEFAGKWYDQSTWVNGAKFIKLGKEDAGKFLGFSQPKQDEDELAGAEGDSDPEESNPKAGVKSYLEGGMIFRIVTTSTSDDGGPEAADMQKLGKIDEPDEVDTFVEVDEKRNWLLITCSIEQVGDGSKVTREWKLSGRNGWDEDIYGEGSSVGETTGS